MRKWKVFIAEKGVEGERGKVFLHKIDRTVSFVDFVKFEKTRVIISAHDHDFAKKGSL